MTLHIENFGKIKNADIELSGLTVVAGQNDTGKSTVGKALFAIVKSISEYPELYERLKQNTISSAIQSLCFDAINEKSITEDPDLFNFSQEIRNFLLQENGYIPPAAYDFIKRLEDFYKKNSLQKTPFFKRVTSLKTFINSDATAEEKIKNIIVTIFGRSFISEINNSCHLDATAHLSYKKENITIADVSFKSNAVGKVLFEEKNKAFGFADATFIDTPLYLDVAFESKLYFGHDIKTKLEAAKEKISEQAFSVVSDEIAKVLNGASFVINPNGMHEWVYKVSPTADLLHISNIASGSRSFGILDILVKSGILKKDSILVLDEPENHLHPEWQLKYAEILALMVREGYYVLLTSHSPFFLQALKLYADKYGVLENKTHFYLAEKINDGSNYSTIKDVTGNTEEIFANLAAPLDSLFMEAWNNG